MKDIYYSMPIYFSNTTIFSKAYINLDKIL